MSQPTGTQPQSREQSKRPSEETAQEAKDVARELRHDAKHKARAARDKTLERGREFAEERKSVIANEVGVFGSAVRSASESLESDGEETVAQYAEMCADELENASEYLRERRIQDLYHDANRFARKHPQIFLGGLFVAGVVAARFLKASEPEPEAPETPYPAPAPPQDGPQDVS